MLASCVLALRNVEGHLGNASSAGLRNLEVWLLEVGVVASGGVDGLVAVVAVGGASVVVEDLVLELELVGGLDDVGVEVLSLRDEAALLVVGGVVEVALALDWREGLWVVGSGALDGKVEVPVTADGASEDEVGDVEVLACERVGGGWGGSRERGTGKGEGAGELHFDGCVVFDVVVGVVVECLFL